VLFDDDNDDDIGFGMHGQCPPHKDVYIELKEQTLHDVVLTDEYEHVIDKEKAKYEHCCEPDMCEVVLVGREFTDSMRLLSNPNNWIGDTAASVRTSPYKHKIKHLKDEGRDFFCVWIIQGKTSCLRKDARAKLRKL
jgi:hypothetical protein